MAPLKEDLKEALDSVLDFLAPRKCVCCGEINPSGRYKYICPDCEASIPPSKGARCLVCSEIIGDASQANMIGCPHCRENPPHFNRSMTSTVFGGAIRKLITGLKYNSSVHYLSDITEFMRQTPCLEEFLLDAVLVPVPLHYSRRLKRPYNQSELIAKCLIKAFPRANCIIANSLKRTRHTATQTRLGRQEREKNMEGAFAFRETIPIAHATRIVIVDDVMTTTATLSECANTLKKCGFINIDAYAFARRL